MPAAALTAETVAPYDFLDLGCSRGRSLEYGRQRFGGSKGLGVDLNSTKVQEARDSGFDAIVGDARKLKVSKQVRWVQMMDFLEHLPDVDTAERVLASSANAATDFLFIFHPSFERKYYLHSLGLRLYWWDWRTHTNHLTIGDYCEMFHRLGLDQYRIRYKTPIPSAAHPYVLSTDEPPDQHEWDPAVHRPKPDVTFDRPVWRAQEIFVATRPMPNDEWDRLTAKFKPKPETPG